MVDIGPFKVVLGGEGSTGKTSLLNYVRTGSFSSDYRVTIGCDFTILDLEIDQMNKTKLICWDSGGQSRFACIRQAYYKGMKGFIILFDITKRSSFERVREWYSELRTAAPDVPFVLVGNKIDLDALREVTRDEALTRARELGANNYVETSVKDGIDTIAPFQLLAKQISMKKRPILQQAIPA